MAHRHSHQAFHLLRRAAAPLAKPLPSPLEQYVDPAKAWLPSVIKRAASDSSACAPDDTSGQCGKPSDSNNITLPIALGVAIPIVFALVLFVWLHRRHVGKLRKEEANDPHKSLDFGMDPTSAQPAKKKGKKGPEMAVADLGGPGHHSRGRGLSMDMDLGSPYVLPPGLQGSRESLHSMSRTIHSQDDRYRPATTFIPNDAHSTRSQSRSRRFADDSSSCSGSTGRGHINDGMNQNLLKNAQRMSRSLPPTQRNLNASPPLPQIRTPEPAAGVSRKASPSVPTSTALMPSFGDDSRDSYLSNEGADLRKSNNYLGALIHSRDPSTEVQPPPLSHTATQSPQNLPSTPAATLQKTQSRKTPPPAINTLPPASRPPRQQSLKASQPTQDQNFLDDESDYGDGFKLNPPSPPHVPASSQPQSIHRPRTDSMPAPKPQLSGNTDALGLGYDVRRLSMGFRPLPPDDPTDNPEQRANRIRSFYKEYFDDSKNVPHQPAGQYYEDYNEHYLGDGAIYDQASGQFVVGQPQRSEHYGRRAMTPPPRAPPRFRGVSRHQATMSGGRIAAPGPRAFSSASGRFGPSGAGAPRPPMPPPRPLHVLPSPHLLKEDSFAIPIDFAPPSSYKDRQAGRPESPRGGSRPYSPMVSAHLPLVSSFDDLAVMPSPHLLRKSGTFTALDFAPPPRFKSSDNGSETGSIRSNRSAMSAQQLHSIRSGAYRVSRIPKEVVGTKTEINESLKPNWGIRP
ncbi:MAG: hypothetical protein L6R38_001520 [Xanthoria sp. 2 TBL-2021]|nr:MAG: hypothetical protein L6R38_001520 [Xanthoria sp. 2 TBL-2021]